MRFKETTEISRDNHITLFFKKHLSPILRNLLITRLLGPLLLSFAPALFSGCSMEILPKDHGDKALMEETTLKLHGSTLNTVWTTLDILIFEDDKLSRLDAYQRIEDFRGKLARASSTKGQKIFFVCADSHIGRYEWSDISSYNSLKNTYSDLENEFPDRPVRTGECRTFAGSYFALARLKPLSCNVVLKTISCDFSATPYAGHQIKDVKVYLTNVSASCPLISDGPAKPVRFINTGQLLSSDIRKFRNPEIIIRDIADEVGHMELHPEASLLCYPNPCTEESPGTLRTRMVIEGKINSMTYYWPITLGEEDSGLERGNRYIYEIRIKRKGVTDPDIPFDPESVAINMIIKPWTEKEEYVVGF